MSPASENDVCELERKVGFFVPTGLDENKKKIIVISMGIESGVNRLPVCDKHVATQEALDALYELHPDLFSISGDEQLSQQASILFEALQECSDCRALQDAQFIRNIENDGGDAAFADVEARIVNFTRELLGRKPLSPEEEAEGRKNSLAHCSGVRASLEPDRLEGGPIFPQKK